MLFPSDNTVIFLANNSVNCSYQQIRLFQQFIDGPHGKVILCRIKIVTESGR